MYEALHSPLFEQLRVGTADEPASGARFMHYLRGFDDLPIL